MCMCVTVDYNRNGVITDDVISSTIIHTLPDGVRLTVVLDACHSGTGANEAAARIYA
jgi:metacaspase-1